MHFFLSFQPTAFVRVEFFYVAIKSKERNWLDVESDICYELPNIVFHQTLKSYFQKIGAAVTLNMIMLLLPKKLNLGRFLANNFCLFLSNLSVSFFFKEIITAEWFGGKCVNLAW